MATTIFSNQGKVPAAGTPRDPDVVGDSPGSTWQSLERVLGPLASLKLTVALFAMSIFIVLAGTLAQVEHDIWEVIDDYFRMKLTSPLAFLRSSYAWIDFQIFFPKSFFHDPPQVPGGFPFPKGWLIGLAMAVNLLAAHAVRFKVQAKGTRLWAGLGVIGIGALITTLVILSGSNKDGFQAVASFEWQTLWMAFKVGLAALWVVSAGGYLLLPREQSSQRWLLLGVNVLLAAGLAYLVFFDQGGGLQDSSMRILWQLIKATFAGLVLLAGCIMVFKKRAGVVLLHGGIGLMMFSEVLVGLWAVEGQMQIEEGQTANYVQDIRQVELAVIEPGADDDHVTVIPQSFLIPGQTVRDEKLPFDIQVEQYLQNTDLRAVDPKENNPATAGAGLVQAPEAVRPGSGTDTDSKVDIPSAYVKLIGKNDSGNLGTYLVSLHLKPQPVKVGDKNYDVQLRFKRGYRPYAMKLLDVRKDDYVGTDTASSYSSDLHLVDARHNVDRDVRIWMNNPLRYAGETFYQSSYFRDPRNGREYTTLQVVTNTGWMIPYVSCMIVAVGMLYHFSVALVRFLNRRASAFPATAGVPSQVPFPVVKPQHQPKPRKEPEPRVVEPEAGSPIPLIFTVAVVLISALWIGSKSIPPSAKPGQMDLYRFGQLPLANEGRIQPIDTLARNSLLAISHKQTFKGSDGKTQPAIRWLLDVMANQKAAEGHKVFRIENDELLNTMGLKTREGFRYAIDEFRDKIGELEKQARLAHEVKAEQRSLYQSEVLELADTLRHYLLLQHAFSTPLSPMSDVREEIQFIMGGPQSIADLARLNNVPLAVPPAAPGELWRPLASVVVRDQVQAMARSRKANSGAELATALVAQFAPEMEAATGNKLSPAMQQQVTSAIGTAIDAILGNSKVSGEENRAAQSWTAILAAYHGGDAKAFDAEVEKYQTLLAADYAAEVNLSKSRFEAFFNHLEPFYHASVLYLMAFFLSALGWLVWNKPLNQAAFWLIAFTLAFHTLALVGRIYISGRPPVTNLYSSAVFIGWGAVVLGMIMERVFRIGIGNIIAAVAGSATLLIAHFLSFEGDTFKVLVAVLDTNFWLATHVVCITLGYATTFVAGLLGLIYVLRGVATPSLSPTVGKDLSRMIYGTLCFATLLSFVGTVLGGLWADDSWGRFWGWDPKENGALIIVLWNALVLHARWGGMVKDRGVAVLAIVGNIVTSWSWFGVNQLGAGLHSYGFTKGVALALLVFVVSQLLVIGVGCLPKRLWMSSRG